MIQINSHSHVTFYFLRVEHWSNIEGHSLSAVLETQSTTIRHCLIILLIIFNSELNIYNKYKKLKINNN